MHTFIQYSIILSSFYFWFYVDSIKIFEKKIINSALIHAIISGLGHSICIIYEPQIILDYSNFINNNMSDLYIILPYISFGYSFYDLYIGISSKKLENMLHGLIFAISFTYFYLKNHPILSYYIMITEISSIFLNLRPCRKKWIDLAFALSFFSFRLIMYPSIIYIYLIDPNNTEKYTIFLAALSITALNIYWFYFIVKKTLNTRIVKEIEYSE